MTSTTLHTTTPGARPGTLSDVVRRSEAVDRDFLDFLFQRLSEETIAATHRRQTTTPEAAAHAERGLRFLDELVRGLKRGEMPDHLSLGLLTVAYSTHPDFRPAWNRWNG